MCSNYYNSEEADKSSGNVVINCPLSENVKSLGIERIARDLNTIVLEITLPENDPFVIRIAINFKSWNSFINDVKTDILTSLEEEITEKKQLNRIVVSIVTILNKNYEI